ncbi:MAG: rhomboid family intramembrane serine protease [Lachnospiraceae bacterium]|nr:rhomboid family intramembrane serine protease [Lachnospiraceae bacterium]
MLSRDERTPYVTGVIAGINILVFLIAEIFGGSTLDTNVLIRFGGAYTPYIRDGEYWRLLTSMFMHSGIRHLLNNMLLLYVLGQHLEFLLGRVRYTAVYLAGGLAADVIAYLWYLREGRDVVSVGASGAVFAVIGTLVYIIIRNRGRVDGLSMRQMLIMLGFSLYFGLVAADVSNAAHIGGLLAGFLLGVLLYRKPGRNNPPLTM